jgi:hypothetical protein
VGSSLGRCRRGRDRGCGGQGSGCRGRDRVGRACSEVVVRSRFVGGGEVLV